VADDLLALLRFLPYNDLPRALYGGFKTITALWVYTVNQNPGFLEPQFSIYLHQQNQLNP
jgi:hypothetical protein